MKSEWHIDSIDCLDRYASTWVDLARSQQRHPFLDIEVIRRAIECFGRRLMLGRYETDGRVEAMVIVERTSRWVYETFAPSQVPFASLVASPGVNLARCIRELPAALPGALLLSVMHIDRRYLDISPQEFPGARRIPYAETITIESVGSSDEYAASRNKKLRDNIKRYQKRLSGTFGRVELKVVTKPAEMAVLVREHGALEVRGWKGREGSALTQHNDQVAFYTGTLQRLADSGRATGFQLLADGEVIASRFGIASDDLFVFLKTAYAEEHRSLAPGRILQWLAIGHLIDNVHPSAIEFYTKADVDQLQWGTSSRMIEHVEIARSPTVAYAIRVARSLRPLMSAIRRRR